MDALIVFFFLGHSFAVSYSERTPPEEFLHKNTVEIHNSPLHFFQTYFFSAAVSIDQIACRSKEDHFGSSWKVNYLLDIELMLLLRN